MLFLGVFVASVYVHEGIHWIQAELDPDLRPYGEIYIGANPFIDESHLSLALERPSEMNLLERTAAARPLWELEAYAIQLIFLGAGSFVLWKGVSFL